MNLKHLFPIRPWHVALFALLPLPSCGVNLLGPLDDTVFVLETIDGEAIPVTVNDEFGGLAWIVTADTLWLESGHKWRRHSVQHREEGVGGDPLDYMTEGNVVRQGALLILNFDCRDADCIAPDRFAENGTMLEMENTYLHAGQRLMFRPI